MIPTSSCCKNTNMSSTKLSHCPYPSNSPGSPDTSPTTMQQGPEQQNIITNSHMYLKGREIIKYKKKHLEDECCPVMGKVIAVYEAHESF